MDYDDVMAIGSALSQLPNRDAYRRAVHEELIRLVPADDALWIQAADRYGSSCVAIHGETFAMDVNLGSELARLWTRHVIPRWQTAHPLERTPFRVSDVISQHRWRQNEAFNGLKGAMPEYQLTIAPPPPARYRGWVLVRDGKDFSDADVEIAVGIAPVLSVLGAMYDRLEPWNVVACPARSQADLTSRELSVLAVLAEGRPADAIGRRLGISVSTVNKHLEHIYRKLGCGDRLVAITLAHQFDLLPPPDPASAGQHAKGGHHAPLSRDADRPAAST